MSTVRFIEVELTYGCHDGARFELPRHDRPLVVAGPNGSGKTSLIEGIVRTLFGFSRRHADDRRRLEERRPWSGAGYCGRIVLVDAQDRRWSIERGFDSAQVEVAALESGGEQWAGDGNPGAGNLEASAYKRRLEELIGLSAREHYETTACIHQGQLVDTRLSGELLRVAVGGHGQLNAAKSSVADAHRALTRQPIIEGERGANKPRRLEELESEIAELEQTLTDVDRMERARGPLMDEHREASDRSAALDRDIELLSAALAPLGGRRALELEREELARRVGALERSRRRLDDALRRLEHAASDWDRFGAGPIHPDDFPERIAALGPLWERRVEIEHEKRAALELLDAIAPPRWLDAALYGLLGLAVAGLAAAAAGVVWPGTVAAGLGLAGAIAVGMQRRRRRREARSADDRVALLDRRRRDVEQELDRRLDGIPDADTLSPATVDDRRRRFEAERSARRRLEQARETLEQLLQESRDGLEGGPAADRDDLGGAATSLIEWIDAVVVDCRNTLAEKTRAAQATDDALRLPIGVAPESGAVEAALAGRRSEHRELRARLNELERRIMETERIVGSPVALRDRLEASRGRHADLTGEIDVQRDAHALLCDAYDEFRSRDQDRLIDRISQRIHALSSGRLGPIETAGSLEDASLLMEGKPVAFASPPLSYGEHHAVLLGVRLGAADFLASNDVEPPLIVDDPFVHLDEQYVEQVWSMLGRIAERRQVIVATQDRLVLEHLGVQPDIELASRVDGGSERPDPPELPEPPVVDVLRSSAAEPAGDA